MFSLKKQAKAKFLSAVSLSERNTQRDQGMHVDWYIFNEFMVKENEHTELLNPTYSLPANLYKTYNGQMIYMAGLKRSDYVIN